MQLPQRELQQRRHDQVVRRALAHHLLQRLRRLRQVALQLRRVRRHHRVQHRRRQLRRGRRQHHSLRQRADHRLLGQSHAQLALQSADDELDLLAARRHHQPLDHAHLAVLRLAPLRFSWLEGPTSISAMERKSL